jgi:hypothetical protein
VEIGGLVVRDDARSDLRLGPENGLDLTTLREVATLQ